ALFEEGEDPENCTIDKSELKNVSCTEKSVISEKKFPSIEKKKPITPTKTIKKNVIGRRPGPKSKTYMTQFKGEKITFIEQKENNDTNQEQVDSSNIIASSEDLKTKLLDTKNSDVVDSNEAKAKEIDTNEPQPNDDDLNQTNNTEHNKDDNNEDSINLTIGEDDIKLFADEEDTNIEKEDDLIENHTNEETLIKQRESCQPVTASSSRATTGLVKSRRSTTEKRSSVGDKSRSTLKEEKDISNSKPIISVSMSKDEKKEEAKQVKDKVETGNKQ
ncbi:SAFB-like transcription modulator isoform X2, partial [Aphis craccivora]